SGFDTVHLRVQLHKKFSVPLFALIMAMISAPFAFLVGNRGAMAGIGASISVAIAYLAVGKLFEQIGNVNHLPPAIAAWSPAAGVVVLVAGGGVVGARAFFFVKDEKRTDCCPAARCWLPPQRFRKPAQRGAKCSALPLAPALLSLLMPSTPGRAAA